MSTVSCIETGTAARGSTQDTRKNHLAAVPVSNQDTVHKEDDDKVNKYYLMRWERQGTKLA